MTFKSKFFLSFFLIFALVGGIVYVVLSDNSISGQAKAVVLVLLFLIVLAALLLRVFVFSSILLPLRKINSAIFDVTTEGLENFSRGEIEIQEISKNAEVLISKLKSIQSELDKIKTDLTKETTVNQEKNRDLSYSKEAMLNLLEDARSLTEALKMEKESVEKKVEERTRQLDQAHAQDEAILTGIGDGVIAVDKTGKVILFNKSAEKISGFSKNEIVGTHYKDSLHFEKEQEVSDKTEFIELALSGKNIQIPGRVVFFRKDGSKVPVASSASPILDSQGAVAGAVIVFRDITEERQLEKTKEEFFSIAAHELRTPLTVIRGNISLILDYFAKELESKELKDMVADIHKSAIRLISIVNDFLDMSRIEQNRINYQFEAFYLDSLLKGATKSLEPNANEKQIQLVYKAPEGSIKVWADKARVEQVLNNLVGNSIKFTDKGTVTVGVSQNGQFAKVTVTDSGRGIPKEQQEELFRKFQQIKGGTAYTKDVTQGTGLGLYISKLLVEGMGGKIGIESSEIGKGSIFFFTLPLTTK